MKEIIVAGGCFWGVEHYYQQLRGIEKTQVGYTDGEGANPTYQEVCADSGHAEAVYLWYDETAIPLGKILEHFFRIVDPTEKNKQGHDVGVQYRNGIYVVDAEDLDTVKAYVAAQQSRYRKPIQTIVKLASAFYDAEEYHQKYLDKHPGGYCHVNMGLIRPEERK